MKHIKEFLCDGQSLTNEEYIEQIPKDLLCMNKICENCFYSKIRYGFRTGFKYLYCTKGILEKEVASNHTCKYWRQK